MFQKCLAVKNALTHNTIKRSFSSDVNRSPLEGIRILDLSRVLAGPFTTMVLGDLGAEVIKIERPIVGDDTRTWGPPFLEGKTRESAYFVSVNRNKKSVCVDISQKDGQDIIAKLAAKSDILVENFLPGALDKKGLGYDQLKSVAPALIYCSITGFGPDGPYSTRGGYDVIAASIGGLTHVTGEKDGGPMKVGVAVTDIATALYAHGAILAALYQRNINGIGQKIDCNLLSTQVSLMVNLASNFLNTGVIPGRSGTGHASIVPYQTFRTADGYITIGCGNNSQFRELCEKLYMPHICDEPEYKNNEDRVKNRQSLEKILSEKFLEEENTHWCHIFTSCSFPYGPVNTMDQVFADIQVRHNNLQQKVAHASLDTVSQVGPAVRYSQAENRIRSGPPVLGEHTDHVMKEILQLTDEQINKYRFCGVIS